MLLENFLSLLEGWDPAFRQPLVMFCAGNGTWADLAQFPWVCPMVGGRQRTVLEKLLASEGVDPPQQLIECGSIDFTKAVVAASDHLALLPAHSVTSDVSEGRLKALAITVPALSRDIAVIFRERSPLDSLTRDLITQIKAIGNDLSREHSIVGADRASATVAGHRAAVNP